MSAFLYGAVLQWKLDLRNRGVLLTYYIVPLVFFGLIGGIFTSINPTSKDVLIQSMSVFGVTMGSMLGSPSPLVELFGSEIKKAYRVGGIPLWTAAANNFISAFIHLFLLGLAIFFTAPFAFNARIPSNLPAYFISLAFFIIVSLTVATVLGLFIKSPSKLVMASQLIFLPSIMLSGIMFPVNLLPKAFETIGKIFPATWGFKLVTNGISDIASIAALLSVMASAVILSAYRLSKIGYD